MTNPATKKTIYVYKLKPTASDPDTYFGFGITDDGEKVYIPVSVVELADLIEGDEVTAFLWPNRADHPDTPWYCCVAKAAA